MSTQDITKPNCQSCGRKVPTSGAKLSSIEFRRKINSIKTMEELIDCKDYLAQFVKSRFRLREYVNEFLRRLEVQINTFDSNIDDIKTWILKYENISDPGLEKMLLGKDPESPVYEFLCANYSGIDDTFHDFYDNYCQFTENPLNRNHVSRALNALGLKSIMKKIKFEGKNKCAMVLYATTEELSEILRKNGY